MSVQLTKCIHRSLDELVRSPKNASWVLGKYCFLVKSEKLKKEAPKATFVANEQGYVEVPFYVVVFDHQPNNDNLAAPPLVDNILGMFPLLNKLFPGSVLLSSHGPQWVLNAGLKWVQSKSKRVLHPWTFGYRWNCDLCGWDCDDLRIVYEDCQEIKQTLRRVSIANRERRNSMLIVFGSYLKS